MVHTRDNAGDKIEPESGDLEISLREPDELEFPVAGFEQISQKLNYHCEWLVSFGARICEEWTEANQLE